MNDWRTSGICRPTRWAIAIGGTTLSGYNLFRMQPGQPICGRIARRKCYKICKTKLFYLVVFALLFGGNCRLFSHVGAQIYGKSRGKQRLSSPCCDLWTSKRLSKHVQTAGWLRDYTDRFDFWMCLDISGMLSWEAPSLYMSVIVKHFFSRFGFSMTTRYFFCAYFVLHNRLIGACKKELVHCLGACVLTKFM